MDNWNNEQQGYNGYDQNQYQNNIQGQWGSQPMQQNWGGNQFQQVNSSETVGVGEWVLMYLVYMIPCVNIIMMFVWAFGSGTKPSKRNYCRAMLIISAVMIVFVFLLFIFVGAVGVSMTSSMY